MEKLVKFTGWDCPSQVPPAQIGRYRVVRSRKGPGAFWMHGQWQEADVVVFECPTQVTVLQEQRGGRWHDWMSDDALFWCALSNIAAKCSGKVLVVGLGLGIVLRHLRLNDAVKAVDVVEISRDVAELVWTQLRPSTWRPPMRLVVGDFFEQSAGSVLAERYDHVVVDLIVGDPRSKANQKLFDRCYDHVKAQWPDAKQWHHGVQRLVTLRQIDEVMRESLRPEQVAYMRKAMGL